MTGEEHQAFEADWWGTCANTYGEETKQLAYARRMGLELRDVGAPGPVIELGGRTVVDLGGGPCSLLLKTRGLATGVVVDPCPYPDWVRARYDAVGIRWHQLAAELLATIYPGGGFDEAWIYNVLQHVEDPELVIAQARRAAKLIRLFEWVDVPPHLGHPHELSEFTLQRWLGAGALSGTCLNVNERGAVGRAFYGVFPTGGDQP